jgi:hypothetical protein
VLGLLAFILAFTFGMTASRFDARRGPVNFFVSGLGVWG